MGTHRLGCESIQNILESRGPEGAGPYVVEFGSFLLLPSWHLSWYRLALVIDGKEQFLWAKHLGDRNINKAVAASFS